MNATLTRLMLTTALCVPLASTAVAQATTQECQDLQAMLGDAEQSQMFDNPDRIQTVIDADDAAACDVELVAVAAVSTETENTDGAQLAETENMTVTLEDEITINGMVYIDRQPAEVDVQGGETEVMVTNTQPDVTVTEGQAEIIVRQAAANVVVQMTQPTIRIEQPAPEIIITMPAPGVDVSNVQPQVEVRQAQPTITVMQAAPMVNLELQRAAEGEEGTMQVTDNATGATMNTGEAAEPTELADTTVNIASVDPTVVYQDGDAMEPTVNRSEPTVTFESAEPQVTVEQMGEPTIEMVQTGEPTVTINTATDEMEQDEAIDANAESDDSTQMALADTAATDEAVEAEAEEMANDAEAAAENVEAETEEMANDVEAEAEEVAAETEDAMADTEAAVEETAADVSNDVDSMTGPAIEMDGFTPVAMDALTGDMLENAPLYGLNNDEIGEVGQVLVGDDGRISSLVLRVGGFLGLGEHAVEVPMNQLTLLQDADNNVRVYIDETEDRLEDMPEYQE